MSPERRDHLQTLERGLAVITAFAGRGPLLTVAELCDLTGLSKPTIRRIALTLESLGYAQASEGRYALTPKVLSLGYAYLSSVRLTDVARPVMEELTDRLGVGTSLAALDGRTGKLELRGAATAVVELARREVLDLQQLRAAASDQVRLMLASD